ncbi:MAG TPA: hypothetical protein VG013_07350 [Gemmataceae bacterium]|jgi:hypothetical protein|nr:hypothetical protein [Gemmataceae bacterium]
MAPSEPRNPFYWLLMLASVLFVATALAIAVVPTLENKAREAGQPPPPSPFRDALRGEAGSRCLLYEVGAVLVFGFLSMALDRLRSLKKPRAVVTIPPADKPPSS